MMVIAVGITSELKAPASLGELELLQQTHRAQQPQRAVHRGQRHPLLVAQETLVHLFSTEVRSLADPLKQGKHPLALGREPLATVVQAGAEAFCVGHAGCVGHTGCVGQGDQAQNQVLLNNTVSCE